MSFYKDLKKFKKNTALVIKNNEFVDYENLIQNAEKFASKIDERSLTFILIDNDFESILALIGIEISNSVSMLLTPNINYEAFINLIKLYQPDYIFLNKKKILS